MDGRFRQTEQERWNGLGSLGLRPLVLAHLEPLFPGAELRGTAVGEVAFQGDLNDLRVDTNLQTSGGTLVLEGRLDALRPANGVTLSGFIEGLDVAALSSRVPEPTLIRGDIALEDVRAVGQTIGGSARLALEGSRFGALTVESLHAAAVARDGILHLDSLDARSSALDVRGSGSLPLTETGPDGEVRIVVGTESLGGLRPFLLGDSVIAADTLTELERDMLVLEGIDPDTLQSTEAVRMAGRADGELVVRGRAGDLSASGLLSLRDAVYSRVSVAEGTLQLDELTYPGRRVRGTLTAGATDVAGRAFSRSDATLNWSGARGSMSVALVQGPDEDVRLRGSFEAGADETTLFLDEFTVRLEGERWNLGGPAIIRWGEDGYRLQNVRFLRPRTERIPSGGRGDRPARRRGRPERLRSAHGPGQDGSALPVRPRGYPRGGGREPERRRRCRSSHCPGVGGLS